ncbi:MAG: hypothetical protein LBF26_02520 [Puniceicoccales bacterium]|jgi:hypothetical protein|nr:hypothetical protein [Puniceicoccales bacterium]
MWFNPIDAALEINNATRHLRQLFKEHNVDWDSVGGQNLRRLALVVSLENVARFVHMASEISPETITLFIQTVSTMRPDLGAQFTQTVSAMRPDLAAQFIQTASKMPLSTAAQFIQTVATMTRGSAAQFIQIAHQIPPYMHRHIGVVCDNSLSLIEHLNTPEYMKPQPIKNINFLNYVQDDGSINMRQISADMFALLPLLPKNIEAQKTFKKLLGILTNQGDIFVNFNRITKNNFANATIMSKLLGILPKDLSDKYLRQLTMAAIFQTQIRQEPGVGSCFAVASAMAMQENNPSVLVRIIADMLTGDNVHFYRNNEHIEDTEINAHVEQQARKRYTLQNAMIYTLADASEKVWQEIDPENSPSTKAAITFMNNFLNKINEILISVNHPTLRAEILEHVSKIFGELKFCYDSKCDSAMWGKNYANAFKRLLEGKGVFIYHTNGGKAFTITDCRDLVTTIVNQVKKEGAKNVCDNIIKELQQFKKNFGGNEPPSGGHEDYVVKCLLGPDAPEQKGLSPTSDCGDLVVIFQAWCAVAQEHGLAPTDKILASGSGHVYTVDFSLVAPELVAMWGHPGWVDSVREFLETGNPLFFIDPNWSNGGSPCKIGVRYDKENSKFVWIFDPFPVGMGPLFHNVELKEKTVLVNIAKIFGFTWDDIKERCKFLHENLNYTILKP